MNTTHVYAYGGLALLLAGSSAVLSSPSRTRADVGAPKSQAQPLTMSDVQVTNTTSQAVPTKAEGTTAVSGGVTATQAVSRLPRRRVLRRRIRVRSNLKRSSNRWRRKTALRMRRPLPTAR